METQNNETGCCKSCNPWKGIAILLIILVAAGAAYYFGTLKGKIRTDDTAAKLTEVTTPAGTDTSKSTSTTSSSDTTGTNIKKNITITYKNPTAFTDKEKKDLENKFINPILAYNNGASFYGSPIDSIIIDKYTPTVDYMKNQYEYSIDIMNKSTKISGMLWGKKINGELQYWVPGCMGLCNFSDSFINQYPELIKAYVETWNKENRNQQVKFADGKIQIIKK